MIKSDAPIDSNLYLDFSQYNKLRKLNQDNAEQGLQAAAKQMESIFLNMMLKSMRDANTLFSEDSMFNSKESDFYRGMYDQQLASNIANGPGIGLAEIIVKQLANKDGDVNSLANRAFDITSYQDSKIPAVFIRNESFDSVSQNVSKSTEENIQEEPLTAITWDSPQQFVEAIYPYAEKAAKQLGVGVKAVLAQAVLETGWGKHVMPNQEGVSSHNFFGIKADTRWDGQVVRKNTLEYRNGIAAQEAAPFRSYASLDDAFSDYVAFLKNNSRYDNAIRKNLDEKQWGYELQQSGYATDPNYGNKIANIVDSEVVQSVAQKFSKKI